MRNQIKKSLLKILPKGQFARGVSVLVGGTAGAQLLMILASPFLTRLYSPEDFGVLAVYVGLLSLFTVISSLRYELAIPLPESDLDAAHITLLSFFLVIVVTIISTILVIVAGKEVANLLGTPKLADYFWLLPLGVFLIGSYQVFNYWAIRTKSFTVIARTKIRQTLATVFVQLVGFKLGGIALLFGQATGQGAGTVTLAKSALKRQEFKNWTLHNLVVVAKRYKRFPLISTFGGLINVIGTQLMPFFLASFFYASSAGLYSLANRVLAIPGALIGTAIGNVFFSDAAIAFKQGALSALYQKIYIKLVIIACPIIVFLVSCAPTAFIIVFGEEWEEAGVYAQLMAVWIGLNFIGSPLSILFDVCEKQKEGVTFQFLLLFFRFISIFIGYKLDSALLVVFLYSVASSIIWFGFLVWSARMCNTDLLFILSNLIKYLLLSLLPILPTILMHILIVTIQVKILLITISMLFVLVYYFCCLRSVK